MQNDQFSLEETHYPYPAMRIWHAIHIAINHGVQVGKTWLLGSLRGHRPQKKRSLCFRDLCVSKES